MTDPRTEEIRARLEGVSIHIFDWLSDGYVNCQHGSEKWCMDNFMAAFNEIAAARSDIPYLLDQIAAKDAEIERLKKIIFALSADLPKMPPDWDEALTKEVT